MKNDNATVKWRLVQGRWQLGAALGSALNQGQTGQPPSRGQLRTKIMGALPLIAFSPSELRADGSVWLRRGVWGVGGAGLIGLAGLVYQGLPEQGAQTNPPGFQVRRGQVALPQASALWKPTRPQHGERVRIEVVGIEPEEGEESVELHYIAATGWVKSETVAMRREEGAWVAEIEVPEKARRVFFYASSSGDKPIDLRPGISATQWKQQYQRYRWSFPVHDQGRRPVPGAWSLLAEVQLISGQSYDQILESLDREIALYPERSSTYLTRLSVLTKRDGPSSSAQAYIHKEADLLRRRYADDPQFLWTLAMRVGDIEPDVFYRDLRARFPNFAMLDQVAFWVCKEYGERQQREKQVSALEAFQQAYPRHQYTDDAERMLLKTLLHVDPARAARRADSLIAGSLVVAHKAIGGMHAHDENIGGGSLPQALAYSMRFELFLQRGETDRALGLAKHLVESGLEDPWPYLLIGEKLAGQKSKYLLEEDPACPVDRALAARVLAAGLALADPERMLGLAGYNTEFGLSEDIDEKLREFHLTNARKLRLWALRGLGRCYADEGAWGQSGPLLQEALALHRSLWKGNRLDEPLFLTAIRVYRALGEEQLVEALCLEVLQHAYGHPQVEETLRALDGEKLAHRLRAAQPAAPDFTLEGLEDRPVRLGDYRGRVVLLYYSHVLNDGLPRRLQELALWSQRWGERGLAILVIVNEGNQAGWYKYRGAWVQARRESQRLFKKWRSDFSFAVDDGRIQQAYKPRSGGLLLIDRQGRLRLRQDQYSPESDAHVEQMIVESLDMETVSQQD
ncbi:MAG: redoxin domain-containing protein [Candidatus Latescibacteria bacterium]|nr:redoxin domain-containing protein [Candidatus Latescibacterota bacterium]